MKTQIKKLLSIVTLVVSILAIAQVAVHAEEKNNIVLLKNSEDAYIIYVEEALNTDFLFSFTNNKDAEANELIFSASGLDANETNVAYISKEEAETLKTAPLYMWIDVNGKQTVVEVKLEEALTENEVTFVNTTTKRIKVDTTGSINTAEEIDGVKITHSQGKVKITEEGKDFSYYIEKVESEETTNFVNLSNKILASEELTNYEKIKLIKEFNTKYNQMLGNIEKWETVSESKEILQPQEAKKDDIYLVWMKNNTSNETDVQILLCDDKQNIEVEEAKKVTVYETVKLPVTYDQIITLIIVLIVLVAIIAALVIIKKRLNSKEN